MGEKTDGYKVDDIPVSEALQHFKGKLNQDKRLSQMPEPFLTGVVGNCELCGGADIVLEIIFKPEEKTPPGFIGGFLNDRKIRPAEFNVFAGECYCVSKGHAYNLNAFHQPPEPETLD